MGFGTKRMGKTTMSMCGKRKVAPEKGGRMKAVASSSTAANFKGNDRLLIGIILGMLTFWLFAQTVLNINPGMRQELGLDANTMNIAVSITALFSGIFIVVTGGLADRIGRMRILTIGFFLSIAGSLLVGAAPAGVFAAPLLILGRSLQGLAGACIMPASLALVKTYWEGPQRQRAVSLWSIGSWGGSGFCSLFGGFVATSFGWRYIFFASALAAVVGLFLIKGTPESRAKAADKYKLDLPGIITFMVAMVCIQVFVTQGSKIGWTSPVSIALVATSIVFAVVFAYRELHVAHAFFDFKLFKNKVYAGATLSNLLVNSVAGTLFVTLSLLQLGGGLSAQDAGLLTLGYAICIVVFIRVGEKLLQRFGARKPMIWGCLIVACAILFLSPANLLLDQYRILAIIGFSFFGIGLAFFATPSTDTAVSNLPESAAGAGAGIYKMASSMGSAFGIAISAAIFTALSANSSSVDWLQGVVSFAGRTDNLAVREAAMVALAFNLVMIAAAIVSIMLTIPKAKSRKAVSAASAPHPHPIKTDDAKATGAQNAIGSPVQGTAKHARSDEHGEAPSPRNASAGCARVPSRIATRTATV